MEKSFGRHSSKRKPGTGCGMAGAAASRRLERTGTEETRCMAYGIACAHGCLCTGGDRLEASRQIKCSPESGGLPAALAEFETCASVFGSVGRRIGDCRGGRIPRCAQISPFG